VTEVALAAHYGVGRAAVRTALNRLYQERLVQPVPRQGYLIAPITLKSTHELFDVRLIVEPAAARLAAAHATPDDLRRLQEIGERARYRPGDSESASAFLRDNTEFHVGVARASGNERLADIIGGLLDEMERLFHFGLAAQDRGDEMYHEHQRLIAALTARDGERAATAAADQINAARAMVLDALLSSRKLRTTNLASDR
jgi:DNA-binding GntR family transcriptional regulator